MLSSVLKKPAAIVWGTGLFLAAVTLPSAYAQSGGNPAAPSTGSLYWILGTIALLFLIVGGGLGYMFLLQKRFLVACREEKQLALFFQSPAGLPIGTVRSIIALIIIGTSLFLAVLLFFKVVGTDSKFPEVLSGILGAVVGFYFGSRTTSQKGDDVLQGQVRDMKTQRDEVAAAKDASDADSVLGKIKKGIGMSQTVVQLLPDDMRKKYAPVVAKLQQGAAVVETFAKSGDGKAALAKGQEILDVFKKENPVKDVFSKALGSFGRVLGGTVPALAIITTVVAIGTELVGAAYEKWRTRILNAPFSLAVTPLSPVDANTAFLLLRMSPIFKKIFMPELEKDDQTFMEATLVLLRQDDVEPFWNRYKDRFESRAVFDQGLKEFRQAAVDMELDPALFSKAGGKDAFLRSLAEINKDGDAQADLHALVTVAEGLQQKGEPVLSIFKKVQAEAGV